jgi:hypothetical protein
MRLVYALACAVLLMARAGEAAPTRAPITFQQDDAKGQLRVLAGERELFVYNYSENWALPHFYPLNTPSGKNLLAQKVEPYPHHRAFWVADTVVRDGVKGDVYNGYYSGKKLPRKQEKDAVKREHGPPFNTASRHVESVPTVHSDGSATLRQSLVWETSRTTEPFPLLREDRKIQIYPMADGEHFMDFAFSLTAAYGDVEFVSDAVHYGWPLLRVNKQFSPEGGGTLTNDRATTGQERTNLKPARWIDYSNTVEGATEGIAVYQFVLGPETEQPLWLTRDYGTFGPRRPEAQSGKPFILKRGEALSQRVGIYVHNGDATGSKVSDMYTRYLNGKVH